MSVLLQYDTYNIHILVFLKCHNGVENRKFFTGTCAFIMPGCLAF